MAQVQNTKTPGMQSSSTALPDPIALMRIKSLQLRAKMVVEGSTMDSIKVRFMVTPSSLGSTVRILMETTFETWIGSSMPEATVTTLRNSMMKRTDSAR